MAESLHQACPNFQNFRLSPEIMHYVLDPVSVSNPDSAWKSCSISAGCVLFWWVRQLLLSALLTTHWCTPVKQELQSRHRDLMSCFATAHLRAKGKAPFQSRKLRLQASSKKRNILVSADVKTQPCSKRFWISPQLVYMMDCNILTISFSNEIQQGYFCIVGRFI